MNVGSPQVDFAPTNKGLPPMNTDAYPIIGVSVSKEPINANISTCPKKVSKQNITIGNNISATKWTIAEGCTGDMGDQKKTFIEVLIGKNRYAVISNFADEQIAVLNKMLTTFTK